MIRLPKRRLRMTALAAFVGTACAAVTADADVLARYRLGEDDPGAVAAGPGNDPTKADPTTTPVGGDLIRLGNPVYSATVPAGGSTLSMRLDGAGDYYYGKAPTLDLTKDFTYRFDANMTAAGSGGFSFLASLGSNFGGIAVVEIGGQISAFFPGAGNGTGTFTPTLGAWHKYQVDYKFNGGAGAQATTLTVDGNVVSTRNGAPSNNQVIDALTLGGNFRLNAAATAAARTAADFEGSFNGLIDNFVFEGTPPPLFPLATINRATGGMTLSNTTGAPYQFLGYRIFSNFQSLDAATWTSIAANYDQGSPGPNQVDPDDNWTALSPNPNFTLSEIESDGGNGVTLANGRVVNLGTPWVKSPTEDVQLELLRPDGSIATVAAVFTGNGNEPFDRSDLNFDGSLTVADWQIFRANMDKTFAGMALAKAYQKGDLNGDLASDIDDFDIFKTDYIAANGAPAFASLLSVPEPASYGMLALGAVVLSAMRRRRSHSTDVALTKGNKKMRRVAEKGMVCHRTPAVVAVALACCLTAVQTAQAGFNVVARYNMGENDPGAAAAGPGNNPSNAVVGPNLVRLGSPTYSADVPAGGSTLSMNFPGNGGGADGTDSFYFSTAAATDVNQRIRYSFDAKRTAAAGDFSFIASLGSNFGAISVVEQGGQISVFFPGAGAGTGTFTPTAGWHRYEVDYQPNGGGGAQVTTLRVDGNVVSTRNGPVANNQIVNAFTLGGNFRENRAAALDGSEVLTSFEGAWNGLIDNVVVETFVQPRLTLEVNTTTGATKLKNLSGEAINFDYYTIKSAGGALSVGGGLAADFDADGDADGADFLAWQRGFGTASGATKAQGDANGDGAVNAADLTIWKGQFGSTGSSGGWMSLQDQNLPGFPAGNGTGNGWEESPNVTANVITEAYLTNSSSMADAAEASLGNAFNPAIFGSGVNGDLTFQFRQSDGTIVDGLVSYVTGGAVSAVPEPATALLALSAILGVATVSRRRMA